MHSKTDMGDKIMVRIGHAVGDEHGKGRGGSPGDQTGKEVRIQDWYIRSGGWKYYLEPVDSGLANRAAHFMEEICTSNKFGYDRDDRWTGYDEIKRYGLYKHTRRSLIAAAWSCHVIVSLVC